MEMDKVIQGLECCNQTQYDLCGQCPYFNDFKGCMLKLRQDALAILQEQVRKKGSWDYGTQCSVCKGTIMPPKGRKVRVNFCPWCGADMRDSYEQE